MSGKDVEKYVMNVTIDRYAHPELWQAFASMQHKSRAERLRTLATLALRGSTEAGAVMPALRVQERQSGAVGAAGQSSDQEQVLKEARLQERRRSMATGIVFTD